MKQSSVLSPPLYHSCIINVTNTTTQISGLSTPEPLRLKEMMKFNQTSNELRLIDDLEDFWQLHLQV